MAGVVFRQLVRLSYERTARRTCCLSDWYARIQGTKALPQVAGHTLRRTLLLPGSRVHTSDTSS